MSLKKTTYTLFIFLLIGRSLFAIETNESKQWVDSVFFTLSPDERIGQLFVYNCPATANMQNTNRLLLAINEQHIGGILFWKGTIEEQAKLTNLAQEKSKVPLMISMDGEWGLAMRLEDGIRYPKKTTLSALTNEKLIYEFGEELGRQCNELRINVSFDPVLDVNLNPENPVINTRSFGDNPQEISRKAALFVAGLKSKNILSVGKHFPGHGDTSQDSHHELAVVTHDSTQLHSIDLAPFKHLINKEMEGIMIGHISVPAIDTTGAPASLSPLIINGLLKKELGFKGLIFTDAMKMKGVSKEKNSSVRALLAGNDILLDPINIEEEVNNIKKALKDSIISMELIDQKCKKILYYKYKCQLNNYLPINIDSIEERINTPQAKILQQKTINQSITVLKNNKEILPIKQLDKQRIAIISAGASNHTQFIQTCALYAKTENYSFSEYDSADSIKNIACKIESADLVILAIHSKKIPDSLIALACGDKKTIIVSFRSPYELKNYPISTTIAEAFVMGYENLHMMQKACAEIIFGGVPAQGKYPINSPNIAKKDDGINTPKTRLDYNIPESVDMNSSILQGIEAIVSDAIQVEAMPGCQILIAKKGTIVYHKSFGFHDYSNQIPVKNTDIYDIASVTKISATLPLIMQLYDKKKIKLDKKISRYLPDLKNTDKKDITPLDLLTHEAGLKPFIPFYRQAIDSNSVNGLLMQRKKDDIYKLQLSDKYFAHKDYRYKTGLISNTLDNKHPLQIADSLFITNAFRDSIWQQIIESPLSDNKKYKYSDLSFLMLQKIIENLEKKPIDELTNDFYNKLGATKTGYLPLQRFDSSTIIPTEKDQFLRKQLLKGHVHDQNAAFMGGIAGHAGIFSNCNDLAKISQLYLNKGTYGGEEFMSPETCQYFTETKSENSRRGLGFDRLDKDGGILYGHYGFTGTCIWIDPNEELIYIFLSNRVNPNSWNKKLMKMDVRTNIIDVIYQSIKNKKPLDTRSNGLTE